MENFNVLNYKKFKALRKKDLSGYIQIGEGGDGAVYKLSEEVCVKLFNKEKTQKLELEALQIGQSSSVIPQIYGYGSNYIMIEYINGPNLKHYLQKKKKLPEWMAEKILFLLEELKSVGFTRHDTEIRHILFNDQGDIKVIDLKRALEIDRTVPTKLLNELKKAGFLNEFLEHVKKLRPALYLKWQSMMDKRSGS